LNLRRFTEKAIDIIERNVLRVDDDVNYDVIFLHKIATFRTSYSEKGMFQLAKRITRSKKNNIQVYIVVGAMGLAYISGLRDMMFESSHGVITYLMLLPFIVGLFYKPFRRVVFSVIRVFWKRLTARNALPVNIREIDLMDGIAFEQYLKPVFERQGYFATVTQGSGDYGADLILRKGRKKYVVQAKRYSSNIGVSAVQQVVAAVKYYKAHGAIVVTNQYFTPAAVQLAKVNGVRLIDRDKLGKMML
jgi:restriction system protein